MMILGDKQIFINTNILIYSFFDNNNYSIICKNKFNKLLSKKFQLIINRQIIREFAVNVTRYNYENSKIPINEFIT